MPFHQSQNPIKSNQAKDSDDDNLTSTWHNCAHLFLRSFNQLFYAKNLVEIHFVYGFD